ncbi:carbohydrate ABC transporter permease [Lacrimispora saccharolytica]|uniref:Binding-protein-dependent transport systems inner membrane component n=1 Tax=Lacrimispora saccharolytica (strain ATCC 35040 / DSM 2544 / NRCC 2533 / WM1) TaxID=610130 RepID=D9R4A8_LACSW|nr:sugar ABC transporter permease [Lacrimispora saccharolytica]ADL04978.1 binding-protein-dependent transport systems inner membrane component [[Clostridium] saccharolyticum WM1]QRV20819.1 sugar ABC transporter permease [Lacrimispora saccharolytica]
MNKGKTPVLKTKEKTSIAQKKENRYGWLFISPYLIFFTVFTGIPFVIAIVMSFLNMKYITRLDNLKFVGFQNFIKVFTNKEIMGSLIRTFQYSLVYVPLIMILGFALAFMLNNGVYMKKAMRSLVFMPYVSNMVAVAVIFKVLLGNNSPIIVALRNMGFDPPLLLLNLKLALPTVAMISVWKGVGLNMVVYLGALQEVPSELLEAAQIDGATKWQRIRNIIIPMISPTTFFLVISSIIGSFQNFTCIQALTEGGPGQATTVMSVNIVRTAFTKYETSLASAMAFIMFVLVMIVTLIQWRGQKKWVNY